MRWVVCVLLFAVLLRGILTRRRTAGVLPVRTLHGAAARIHPLMNVPVPWVFMMTFLAGVGLQDMVPLTIHSAGAVLISHIVGILLTVVGVPLAVSGLGLFRRARTTTVPFETASKLITRGPYRFSRNPMYVSLILVYL